MRASARKVAPRLLALVAFAACAGPVGPIPGGRLEGAVTPVEGGRWPYLVDGVRAATLETRSASGPRSVNMNVTVRGGRVYVDPSPAREWGRDLSRDPRARLRLEGKLYEVRAVRVSDHAEREGFDLENLLFRLDPAP
jgi:hypothetical protein